VDVFLTSDAKRDIEILRLTRPQTGTWGLIFGHNRGSRVYIERLFPAGKNPPRNLSLLFSNIGKASARTPNGLFVFGSSSAIKKAVLGPAFCGKLFSEISPAGLEKRLKFHIVDFDGAFFLSPVRTAAGR